MLLSPVKRCPMAKLQIWLSRKQEEDVSFSKRDFALDLGINESTLYKYLKGDREPTLSIAVKIHRATRGEVSYEDLALVRIKTPEKQKEVDKSDLF